MKIEILSAKSIGEGDPWVDKTIFVMPSNDLDIAKQCATLMASRAGEPSLVLVIEDTDGEGFIKICNRVFRQSQSEFFGYVAQDAFPGRGWLKLALLNMVDVDRGLFAFNDGKWHGLLAGFGLVKREWAVRNYDGDLFYPGYGRHYADAELTLIAKCHQMLAYDPRSVLVEVDWNKDAKPVDAADKMLFKQRAKTLFDGRVTDDRFCKILNKVKPQ